MKYASRKYIDLMHSATSKWTAWEPPIQVKVGDYGTVDPETGEFETQGNIYSEWFKSHISHISQNLSEDFPPVKRAERKRLALVSENGTEVATVNGPTASIPGPVETPIAGTWEFRQGRGALLVMHKPRTEFLPSKLLAALISVDELSRYHVVTETVSCPAYAMYLSAGPIDRISLSFTVKVPLPSLGLVSAEVQPETGWRTNKRSSFFRSGHHEGNAHVYTPLFQLKRKRWFSKKWTPDSLEAAESEVELSLATGDARFIDILHGGSPVGFGGFCDVYKGIHRPSNVKLALKRPRMNEAISGVLQFHIEAAIWSRFRHENILPFFGLVNIKNVNYMASQWIELGNLSRFLDDRLAVHEGRDALGTTMQAAYFAFDEETTIREIASGVAYLHSEDYVHGDIKAQNVLLAADGRALLCDFGLTKLSGSSTAAGMIGAGSLRWKAPELKDRSKSPASDVYAFAMTIVEILTGKVPFSELGELAVFSQVMTGDMRPQMDPQGRQGHTFTHLWGLASRCWKSAPGDRPSMAEVLSALECRPTERGIGKLEVGMVKTKLLVPSRSSMVA